MSTTLPKVALVTGASSGIGRASAIALARDGWVVVVAGRRAEQLQETIDLAKGGGRSTGMGRPVELYAVVGDLTKAEDVEALFAAVKGKYGEWAMHTTWQRVSGSIPS